jgi:DNA-directed RNA polymerase specialized sigma24 family protein
MWCPRRVGTTWAQGANGSANAFCGRFRKAARTVTRLVSAPLVAARPGASPAQTFPAMTTTKRTDGDVEPDFTAAELRSVHEIQAALRELPAHVAARVIRRLWRELLAEALPN